MAFRLRTIDPSAQFSQELTLTALARQVPPALVLAVLAAQDCATPRTRKLTLAATLYRVRCLHLFPRASVQHVFARLARGLRFVWPDDQLPLPGDSALCYRRYQLGARPLAALFHALRRPVATPTTRGAWLWGLRAVALDGTLEAVPDTAANRCAFGGPSNAQGVCAFPQVHAVYMAAPEEHARLYRRLLADVAAERLPSRRARVNPRVVKRKMTKFPVKKPEDRQRRQPWRPIAESLVLI